MHTRTLIALSLTLALAACGSSPAVMEPHGAEHTDMTMDGMVESLAGKSGEAFDQAFIAAMIPHHEGAVEMAKLALENAEHPELKRLAAEIIEAQNREIEMMKGWQEGNWGPNDEAPAAE